MLTINNNPTFLTNHQHQYDANYQQQSDISNYATLSPDQRPDVSSPNYHQHQYDANYQQQPDISNYVTISPDQRPNVSSPNHRQQQPNIASPNRQHQYDANYQQQPDISNNTASGHNSHHHHQPMSNIVSNNNVTITPDSNHHDSTNVHYSNNHQSSSDNVSLPQLFSPQPNMFPNINIYSPQTNFIFIPTNSDIRQFLACLNNSSLANNSKSR
jgi:hypothetical protein